jgi:hypothetical protein
MQPRDAFGELIEVGDVVRLLGARWAYNDHALVEADPGDGTLMVRRFDKARSAWHVTRQRWGAERTRRDMWRGCNTPGQRNNPAFVDRLREW